ncbi:MAG TPA: DUF167 family protein [Planctomycetota bacterium]|nr:DUF167 family protein [Planctomycetota bacterium]
MISVRTTPEGATLKVRVTPGASRERILGTHGDALKVAVREPPERGRANEAVARALAAAVGARPADVEVIRGHASRDKLVLFRGLGEPELRARLNGLA